MFIIRETDACNVFYSEKTKLFDWHFGRIRSYILHKTGMHSDFNSPEPRTFIFITRNRCRYIWTDCVSIRCLV